ncbi:hypothetical protein IAR50_003585 [Cryptococcus sp. DSM 104548]
MRPSLSLLATLFVYASTRTVSSSPPEPSPSLSVSATGHNSTPEELQLCCTKRDSWAALRLDEGWCPSPPLAAPSPSTDSKSTSIPTSETQTSSDEPIGTPNTPPTPAPEGTGGEEPFVSFEEWKKIKMAEEDGGEGEDKTPLDPVAGRGQATEVHTSHSPTDPASSAGVSLEETDSPSAKSVDASSKSTASVADAKQSSSSSQNSSHQPSATPPSHHHNKYNYASPDCSARIHSASPQTLHPSSLLHKSRDRYMLTPCRAHEHWVVVELCDEIRIEAVEIAVWEFFSGVVREVRVSVGGEDEEEDEDDPDDDVQGRGQRWKEVGSFVGRNVRGPQTFKLSSPTSFHRFIRLDFPSYYGSEYYCPVSALKVHGMNQMEAFKWEQKQLSAIAKERDRNGNKEKEREQDERRAREREEKEKKEVEERDRQQQREKELDALEKLLHEQAGRLNPDILTEPGLFSTVGEDGPPTPSAPESAGPVSSDSRTTENETESTIDMSFGSTSPGIPEASESTSTIPGETSTAPSSRLSDSTTTPPSTTSTAYTRSPPPRSDSSESIYAFIIRRLNALEGNSSLVARYIEEQAKVMRSMLKRVESGWDEWKGDWEGDDRWRWQQERMRQEDRLGKAMSQLEQQRVAFETERKAIQTQLRVLADELSYERRRGIAQLIVMITAIILGVASQSRTIDAFLSPLLTEARRRKNIYDRKKNSGPLTGLRIDMGAGRPPAIIGQPRPRAPPPPEPGRTPTSPTPTPRVKDLSRHGSHHSSGRRPTTPGKKRAPQLGTSALRSVSDAHYYDFGSPVSSAPNTAVSAAVSGVGASLASPRPRVSFPGNPRAPARKLARSSHLHTMEADRVRAQVQVQSSSGYGPDGGSALEGVGVKRRRPRPSLANASTLTGSPGSHHGNGDDEKGAASDRAVEDSQGEWGTETDFETEASASEIDSEMDRGLDGQQDIAPPSYLGALGEKT